MARAAAKHPKPAPPDPLLGKRVAILRGIHAGKRGIALRCYRDRVATADTVMIELEGSLPGWGVVCPAIEDVEVCDAR